MTELVFRNVRTNKTDYSQSILTVIGCQTRPQHANFWCRKLQLLLALFRTTSRNKKLDFDENQQSDISYLIDNVLF